MNFCPFCEGNIVAEIIVDHPTWEFRKELIQVDFAFYRCPLCNEEWTDTFLPDPHEQLYAEYEKRTGINPRYRRKGNK